MDIFSKIQALKPCANLLNNNLMGIEKEGLRVARKGGISQAAHPKIFGCALTHPNITTDFSESLIELVTPPMRSAKAALDFLQDTQHYLYHHLPKDQNLWVASMPCVIRGETYIPIAQYGSSNQGMMKTVYRRGLSNRYGSVMQTIAGIHFNYSFSQDFFKQYQKLLAPQKALKTFSNEAYMGLTRNVVRYGWVIPYLFGASPAVCKSFLKGYHQHSLMEFNNSTLYKPYATSLRMGDIGYQNLAEDEAGVKANYNSLGHYVNSLKAGMYSSYPEYEKIKVNNNGVYQQLNSHILQIENEYYACVRPKPKFEANQRPLNSLLNNGVDYIELRSLDINPLLPLGIDEQQVYFLEAFLLFCLLQNSPAISTKEQFDIDNNDQLVAHEGRKPALKLKHKLQPITLKDWGNAIIKKISACAILLGHKHQQSIADIAIAFDKPSQTPAAIVLKQMQDNNQGFFEHTHNLAKQYQQRFLAQNINQAHFDYLDNQAKISCQKQREIEKSDTVSFDVFLQNYFQQ